MYRLLIWLREAQNRLWVKPALGCVLAVLLALLAALGNRVIAPDLLPDIERDTLDGLLTIIASSMLAVATFSMSIMVSAFASAAGQMSPRATALVAGDSTTQNAITTFISAFIYAVIAKTALGLGLYGPAGRFILFASTMTVLVVLIVTLVRWVKVLSTLGRMADTLQKIETATCAAMCDYRRAPAMGARAAGDEQAPQGRAVHATHVAYVRHIDMQALQEQAAEHEALLHIRVRPGVLAHPGTVLLVTQGGREGEQVIDDDKLRKAFVFGDGRSFDQDPRFGLIVLCEVAQRALSPAVNDPGTAIQAMNTITRVLVDARPDDDDEKDEYDRLTMVPLDETDFIEQSFDPIARDGAAVLEVHLRMQKLLAVIAEQCPGALARASRRQAKTALLRGEGALMLEQDKAALREQWAASHGDAAA